MGKIQRYLSCVLLLCVASGPVNAESLRCNGDIVDIEDTKAEVIKKCGKPEITDSFCEKTVRNIVQSDGKVIAIEDCQNVDIWTYSPGKGQFLTNLYFAQGKLREMRYGDRIN